MESTTVLFEALKTGGPQAAYEAQDLILEPPTGRTASEPPAWTGWTFRLP